MKKSILVLILCVFSINLYSQQSNPYTVELARKFSKDLFSSNGVYYMEPVVRIVNATSNSRFYTSAYIPSSVKNPYFKVTINGMAGVVSDDLKYYSPQMPTEEFDLNDVQKFIQYNLATQQITYLDTAGLVNYIFLNMMYDGTKGSRKGLIQVPQKASTALGTGDTHFLLPHESMETLFKNHPLYNLPIVPQSIKDSVMIALNSFPEDFTLYGGNNLDYIVAGIPQVEIGSLFGTELLLRVIPPVNLGETVGDFAFWGIGLKHSISQYFETDYNEKPAEERVLDLAAQIVYQGTHLKNKVGVTQAELTADATMFSFNLNASKSIKNWFDIYTGISYEIINIKSQYAYKLPIEVQWQLGLLEKPSYEPTPGHPGDQSPQTTELSLNSDNLRWTIGIIKQIGSFGIFADYSFSRFDILSAGLQYNF